MVGTDVVARVTSAGRPLLVGRVAVTAAPRTGSGRGTAPVIVVGHAGRGALTTGGIRVLPSLATTVAGAAALMTGVRWMLLGMGGALAATMAALDPVTGAVAQCVVFAAGLVLNGVGGAMYIGSQLGPGPRDGLMTGLHHRTGVSLRLIRTGIEVSVLALGWLLGGDVGAGTVVFAVTIGPLVQFFLPYFIVDLGPGVADAGADDGDTQAEMR